MLSIKDLSYAIEGRSLFESATAQIASGWKVGLIGRNGTGKSTLLRLIREDVDHPSADTPIRLNTGARLGWVAQEIPASDDTIMDVVLAADKERDALMRESETATDPDRIGEIHARLTDIDAWSAEARAAEVLMGLGFTHADLSRKAREFSGGWRMRAAIAGVLFSQPDLLLLDEPTNYLDLEGAAWLESYIKRYPNTVIIVSHDRELLNNCVTHTLALEHKKLTLNPGGYDAWLKKRAETMAQLEAQRAKQDADRKHLQSFVDRFRAKATKARQAQSRIKMLEKMQDITIPLEERTTPFNFPTADDELSPPLLQVEQAEMGYGDGARILSDVTLRLDPEDRVAIVGANGQGKTTLVKSIANLLPLMDGEVKAAKAIRIGYFSQDQMDRLHSGDTVLDHVRRALPKDTPVAKQRARASAMGFSHEKVETRVEALSGGEKVRLLLGLTAMEQPHILILDEPTSHLDIDSREALIYALNDFKGAILLITHDVYLAEATADELWLVKDGKASPYDGDLNDYRALVMAADRGSDSKKAKPAAETSPSAPVASEADKVDKADKRRKLAEARKQAAPLKQKAAKAEKEMENASKRIAAIDEELSAGDLSSDRIKTLMTERASVTDALETAEIVWLEASEAYEAAVAEG